MRSASRDSRSRLRWMAQVMLLILPWFAFPAPAETLGTVTVEAQRRHDELVRQVDQFVKSAIIKSPFNESLLRWNQAVCPLVAGMTAELGESVLVRFSATARDAHVPLAGKTCKPNLFIILAKNPPQFLKLWRRHSPLLFNTEFGIAPVRKFIESDRPVRVWYNVGAGDTNNPTVISSLLATSALPGMGVIDLPTSQGPSGLGSRLTYLPSGMREIGSAVLVIDPARLGNINIGQLTDYVTIVSLMEIDQDADIENTPTILRLFAASAAEIPAEKTDWDKALLGSLYATEHRNRMQVSQMKTSLVRQLETNFAQR